MTTEMEVLPAEPARGGAVVKAERPTPSAHELALRTIERLVKAQTPIDQLERFIALQERLLAQQAKAEADADFAAMQDKLPTIEKNGEVYNRDGSLRFRFAKLEDLLDGVRPVLAAYGFSPRFEVATLADGWLDVVCILSHRMGSERRSSFTVRPEPSDYMTPMQAMAAARSFGKRQALMDVLGIAARGEDVEPSARGDAGRRESRWPERGGRSGYSAKGDTRPITEKQLARLITIMRQSGRAEAVVKAWAFGRYGIKSRRELTREQYEDFCAAIEAPGDLPEGRFEGAPREREPGEEG